jgi:hypothetical protein
MMAIDVPEPSTHVYPVTTLKAYKPRIHPFKVFIPPKFWEALYVDF